MFSRRSAPLLLAILVIVPAAAAQDGHLWVGPNVNMVSGTTFPDGDPFLQRQNEPSVAVSTRDTMTLMGFANDYRAVDLPGLQLGKETGDAWLGVFKSFDGGQTWQSTLLPGYPQDSTQEGLDSPIGQAFGAYDAAADPVVRAGTHGLFYLSGIVFDRGDPARSALFVARYVDLNNLESGDTIEYIDTRIVKANPAVAAFIDKPWMAVDIPRSADPAVTISVNQSAKVLSQSVECGNVYLAWAEVEGVAPNQWSTIFFKRSTDCGTSWEPQIALNDPGTMAQGVTVAVSPTSGDVWVAWRQFDTDTMTTVCVNGGGYWKNHLDEWPLESMVLGETLYSKDEAYAILNSSKGGHASYILAHQLIPAKLSIGYNMIGGEIQNLISAADAWLADHGFDDPKPGGVEKQEGLALKDQLEVFNNTPMEGDECPSVPGPDDTIMAAHMSYGGQSFTSPVMVSALHPFEQGTTEYSFRTNAYPTMTVDDLGRAYLAWTTRGLATPRIDTISGDARIVVSTSTDENPGSWTSPRPIDQPGIPGHQIKPSITFAGGKVVLVYYDLRQDFSGIFDRFIADIPAITPIFRHTVDVRAAQADPGAVPEFTSYGIAPERPSSQVSRYVFMAQYPETGDPPVPEYSDTPEYLQLQYNPPSLPIYLKGLKPFFGDYLDVGASPPFVPDGDGWRFNTTAEDPATFHAVWTDNRDVEAPYDGNWSNYVVPGDEHESFYDPEQTVPACDQNGEGQTRIRNQNIYTARLSSGLSVGSAGASRPIDALKRAFVVNVRNDSEETKQFELSFAPTTGVTVSFEQFYDTDTLSVWVAPFSSASRTVFVTAAGGMDPQPVRVVVEEVGGGGLASSILLNPDPTNPPPPADSGLLTVEQYNPAMMNRTLTTPAMMNLAMMNPAMMNLAMMNLAMMNPAMMNLAMMNPAMMNLAMMNLAMMNPAMMNLAMMNPAMMNPAMMNLAMMNLAMMNPAMMNLAMMNPAMMNLAMMNAPPDEITWEMTNEGNASAAYSFNLLGENPPRPCEPCNEGSCDPGPCFVFQLFIYREYTTPAADGCELIEATQQQMLVNVVEPDFLDPADPAQLNEFFRDPWRITDQGLDNPTFTLEPGDTVYATLWIYDYGEQQAKSSGWSRNVKSSTFGPGNVWASIVAQPVNSDDDDQVPSFDSDLLIVTTTSLPDATAGVPYTQILTSTTGLSPQKTWSLVPGSSDPPGISVSSDGVLSGTVTSGGTYQVTIEVTDTFETDRTTLTLQVNEAIVEAPSAPDATPIGGHVETPVTVLVEDGNGDPLQGYEVTLQLAPHPNDGEAHENVATTVADGIATFDSVWFDRTGNGYEMVAEVDLAEGVSVVTAPSDPFNVIPLVVTTTADDGPGSLRRAMENANRNEDHQDSISFDIAGPGPHTIAVLSPLESISDSVIIDATTQPPGYVGAPLVRLDGIGAGPGARGFGIHADASEVRGLTIVNFAQSGIYVGFGAGSLIENNYIGTDGDNDLGNGSPGINANNCSGLTISGNVISGNDHSGIALSDSVTDVDILNNRIGTNAIGNADLGNSENGILVYGTSVGDVTISNNLISGNDIFGVSLRGGTHDNDVVGNRIGTDIGGEFAVPNASGILVSGSDANTIGGTTDAARNIISGNTDHGIVLFDADQNQVFGNYIGTDDDGTIDVGNGFMGIEIWGDSQANRIGGPNAGEGNLISDNLWGVYIQSPSNGNFIEGNLIGTDVTGAAALGYTAYGVYLRSVGDIVRGNVVGGNVTGINLAYDGGGHTVTGNFVGIDRSETVTIGNVHDGISIEHGSTSNRIGGPNPGDGNVLVANGRRGIFVQLADSNTIQGNWIGTNSSLVGGMGNALGGIVVVNANSTVIGGSALGAGNTIAYNVTSGIHVTPGSNTRIEGNLISGNSGHGIEFYDHDNAMVIGNLIGVDPTGDTAMGNGSYGVWIRGDSSSNTIGGPNPGEENVISDNGVGVRITSTGFLNLVEGNLIGTDASGSDSLGNSSHGVAIYTSTGNTIRGNLISGQSLASGVYLSGASFNNIVGNTIGTNQAITETRPNHNGIELANGAHHNTIGVIGQGNVVCGSTNRGILARPGEGVEYNIIHSNWVGTDPTMAYALGNEFGGIMMYETTGTIIGGHAAGAGNVAMYNGYLPGGGWPGIGLIGVIDALVVGNVASANIGSGISLISGTSGTVVENNRVGTTADGSSALGNGYDGIGVYGDATTTGNTLTGNLIASNRWGIVIWNFPNPVGPTGNTVIGNTIGLNITGTTALPNEIGIYLRDGAHNNTIGGPGAASNTIIGNSGAGVAVGSSISDTTTTGNAIISNSIYGNGGLGIDLASDGVTANDVGDIDIGPHDLLNFPWLTWAVDNGAVTRVIGTVDIGVAFASLTLQFFANPLCDGSGNGEAQTYLSDFNLTTGAGGTASFGVDLPTGLKGQYITATTRSALIPGSTSEISACVLVN